MSDEKPALADRLGEGPIPEDLLWRVYWGEEAGNPAILARVARALRDPHKPSHTLIYGRYGSGKTSLLQALHAYLKKEAAADSGGKAPLQLWLHMPLITSNTGSSPVAAVIGAIVENLCGGLRVSPPDWTPDPAHQEICPDLLRALDDLWLAESGCVPECSPTATREPPRANRMPGSATSVSGRAYRANTIEQYIDYRLGWRPDQAGTPLIVYLDDVDRCHQQVPAAIIRLLLRFRGFTRGIRFVIACDRDLMERGVEDWMHVNGTSLGGQTFVTANSALEKYLDHMVRIPRLSEHPFATAGYPAGMLLAPEQVAFLTRPRPGLGTADQDPILARWDGQSGGATRPNLAECLLTWLLADMKEEDVVQGANSADFPSPNPAVSRETLAPTPERRLMPEVPEPDRPDKAMEGNRELLQVYPSSDKATKSDRDIIPTLTYFGQTLRSLTDIEELETGDGERHGLLRLRSRYRDLGGALTPRQLKYYLRARLIGTSRGEPNPALTLLRQVFHTFWRLSEDEPELFRFVSAAAEMTIPRTASPGSRELALFHGQVKALIPASTVLSEERLREAWPSQTEERVLLLRLLSTIRREARDTEDLAAQIANPDVPGALSAGRDPDFTDWVRDTCGRTPQGATIAEQVSSFQDYVLAAYRQGDTEVPRQIGEYVNRFLDRHLPYFNKETATSLSNLAVLINDVPPYEPQSDQLFSTAAQINPVQGAVRLYYAEFLLTVALDQQRWKRLVPDRYKNLEDLLESAQRLVETASASDEASRFYAATLHLRLDKARRGAEQSPTQQQADQEAVCTLVKDWLPLFLTAARNGDVAPLNRLDTTLDSVIGRDEAELMFKAHVFGIPWGVAAACRPPRSPPGLWRSTSRITMSVRVAMTVRRSASGCGSTWRSSKTPKSSSAVGPGPSGPRAW